MKRLNHPALFCIFYFALCILIFAPKATAATPNPILGVMAKELNRSMVKLHLPGQEKPYFISYRVVDWSGVTVEGYLGSITESSGSRSRNLIADVRVGGYRLDNSAVDRRRGDFNEEDWRYRNVRVPVENDTVGLSQRLWLSTDYAYKRALDDYQTKKRDVVLNPDTEGRTDDFSREKPVVAIGDEVTIGDEVSLGRQATLSDVSSQVDRPPWKDRIGQASALFKEYPAVTLSRVRFDASARTIFFVNSEGSKIQDGSAFYSITISAETRSTDGMPVRIERRLASYTGDWPGDTLEYEIRRIAERLTALKEAKPCEGYVGPVLILAPASASFIAAGAMLFLGDKMRWKDEEGLLDKVGERILPASVSIIDDPAIKEYNGDVLAGFYRYDDEGIPGRRVTIVERGVLKNFLLGRTPIKGFETSNGHGKARGWGAVRPDIGNLIVESDAPIPVSALKARLIEECKRQEKPFGMMITGLDYPTGIEAYKVHTDGREELVRGAEIVPGSPLSTLGKITALGDDPRAAGNVAAPSLLLSELEIRKIKKGIHPPPILPAPTE